MPNEASFLDIVLLGKEYRVACPSDQRSCATQGRSYVDGKMRDIAEKTKSNLPSASPSWLRSTSLTSTSAQSGIRCRSSIRKLNLK
jgi:hypothetical protein